MSGPPDSQPSLAAAGRTLVTSVQVLRPSPQRFPMSHAPFLAALDEERILLTWFAGSREWAMDVGLLSATLHVPTGSWSAPSLLASEVMHSLGNSVVHRDVLGQLHLWYVRTARNWQDGEIVHICPMQPNGMLGPKAPLPLPRGWLIRGRPVSRDQRLFLPVYHETEMVSAVWEQLLEGEDGRLSEAVGAPGGLIHPVLLDFGGAEFRCFFRNSWAPNRIHHAYSMDRGATWSRAHPTDLPNPNSGIDVATVGGDLLVCVYNHSQHLRTPLSLAVSRNCGIAWTRLGDLENESGEYSYPSLLTLGEKLYLAYTHRRSAIKVVTLDRALIASLAIAPC